MQDLATPNPFPVIPDSPVIPGPESDALPAEKVIPTTAPSPVMLVLGHTQLDADTSLSADDESSLSDTSANGSDGSDKSDDESIRRVSLKVPVDLHTDMMYDVDTRATPGKTLHGYILFTLSKARHYRIADTERETLILRVEELRNKLATENARTNSLRGQLSSATEAFDDMMAQKAPDNPVAVNLPEQGQTDSAKQLEALREVLIQTQEDLLTAQRETEEAFAQITTLASQLADESARADQATEAFLQQKALIAQLRNLAATPPPAVDHSLRDAIWFEIMSAVCTTAAQWELLPADREIQLLTIGKTLFDKKLRA